MRHIFSNWNAIEPIDLLSRSHESSFQLHNVTKK